MTRIIGIGVCGKGEAGRYMRATCEEFKRLCDDVIIARNETGMEEARMLNEYDFWHYSDNRIWGIHQPSIKTDLLKRAAKLNPDFIIALDFDEIFAPEFTREKAEELAKVDEKGWYFLVVNLYNDKDHFAHDQGIQRFWNIRFFKFCPELGLEYQRKRLHCGLAPPYAYKFGWYAPYYLEHYGLMKQEDRDRKVKRYETYDPNAVYKAKIYYDDLKKDLKMIPFNRQATLEWLKKQCKPRNSSS